MVKARDGNAVRVLYCIRDDYKIHPAGDTGVLLQMVEFLKTKGIEVTICSGEEPNYSKYDLIHLFNLTRISETYLHFSKTSQLDKPIVISPIYWDIGEIYSRLKYSEPLQLRNYYAQFRKKILSGCAQIYPSSNLEKNLIAKEYGEALPQTVIYCGIDPEKLQAKDSPHFAGDKDFILCAARICPKKNQLALAKAAHQLNVKLLLAGEVNNPGYLRQCLAYKNVKYLGVLTIKQLVPLYEKAKLHVLCGLVETPGLANLEAGACGCNILSTTQGSAREYFGDMALYCDPYSEDDILEKVKIGLAKSRQPHLKAHILDHYCLSRCMEPLYQSYLSLLK